MTKDLILTLEDRPGALATMGEVVRISRSLVVRPSAGGIPPLSHERCNAEAQRGNTPRRFMA